MLPSWHLTVRSPARMGEEHIPTASRREGVVVLSAKSGEGNQNWNTTHLGQVSSSRTYDCATLRPEGDGPCDSIRLPFRKVGNGAYLRV